MTWEVIARAFALKVVARKGPEISRKPMVKALMRVTPSIARWDELDELVSRNGWGWEMDWKNWGCNRSIATNQKVVIVE